MSMFDITDGLNGNGGQRPSPAYYFLWHLVALGVIKAEFGPVTTGAGPGPGTGSGTSATDATRIALGCRSMIVTSWSCARSSRAMDRPTEPAPAMTTLMRTPPGRG